MMHIQTLLGYIEQNQSNTSSYLEITDYRENSNGKGLFSKDFTSAYP